MSRTTRTIRHWVKFNIEKYLENYDPRSNTHNGYDGKPHSLLYEGRTGKRGWSRDFIASPKIRRDYKRSNRRWQRRNAKDQIELELLD